MVTDSSSESAIEPRLSCTASPMASGGADDCVASAPQMPVVCAREVFGERPRKRSSPLPSWADVPAEILGTVVGLLPCLADRARVRSVCRHWRASALIEGQARPAPLPVLVLPRFRFSCLTSDRTLTAARRAPLLPEVAGDDVRVVGASDDWLVAVRPSRDPKRKTDGECFLLNAFSSEVVRLPPLRPCDYSSAHPYEISFYGSRKQKAWLHSSAVLSAPPSSGAKYIVAALSGSKAARFLGLALWQPGMTSWYFFQSIEMSSIMSDDLVFYQGKLYMVSKTRPSIFALEVREDEHGVSLSCPEKYTIDLLTPFKPTTYSWMRCNMVVQRGKLLLIIRFFGESTYYYKRRMEWKPHSVEVFELYFSTSPCGFTRIHNLDGDCVFVDPYGCRSFSPGLYVGVQGDLIYFTDECIDNRFPYVYNMRDGTVRRFADGSTSTTQLTGTRPALHWPPHLDFSFFLNWIAASYP